MVKSYFQKANGAIIFFDLTDD